MNDGSLLFLQHMISKFEPNLPERQSTARASPLCSAARPFSPGAPDRAKATSASGSSRTTARRHYRVARADVLQTGIGTYIWIVTNRKEKRRKGKIQLIDAREFYVPMRRSMGDKRRKLGEAEDGNDQIAMIVKIYGEFKENDVSKIFDNVEFGYTRVTVERPLKLRYQMTMDDKSRFLDACPHLLDDVQAIDKVLGREPQSDWNEVWVRIESLLRERSSRWKAPEQKLFRSVFTQKDPDAKPVRKGVRGYDLEPDSDLRDFENIPLKDNVDEYFKREVLPHVPDAWMDRSKDKIGYEINFNRHFYKYTPPRPLEEIDADLKKAEEEIVRLLREVTA